MAEDQEDTNSDNFPGLNKAHGFFKAIERNQRDRDLYQKQIEVHAELALGYKSCKLFRCRLYREVCCCCVFYLYRNVEMRRKEEDAETESTQKEASISHLI